MSAQAVEFSSQNSKMKKTVIVISIVVLFVITLVGCSNAPAEKTSASKDSSTQQANSTTASTDGQSASTTESSDVSPGKSANAKSVPRKLSFSKGSLPSAFEKAVTDSFVTVVAFYDSDDYSSKKAKESVEDVVGKSDYNDQIKYLSYDITGKIPSKVAKLTTALETKYAPNVSIIDADSNIVFEDSGFTNTDYFENALYNAVYKDKSPAK